METLGQDILCKENLNSAECQLGRFCKCTQSLAPGDCCAHPFTLSLALLISTTCIQNIFPWSSFFGDKRTFLNLIWPFGQSISMLDYHVPVAFQFLYFNYFDKYHKTEIKRRFYFHWREPLYKSCLHGGRCNAIAGWGHFTPDKCTQISLFNCPLTELATANSNEIEQTNIKLYRVVIDFAIW